MRSPLSVFSTGNSYSLTRDTKGGFFFVSDCRAATRNEERPDPCDARNRRQGGKQGWK